MFRWLMALCLLPPLLAWGNAGKLDSFEGTVTLTGKAGARKAAAGMAVEEGDTVRTGANAWALFEMDDGASITVRANTEMRVTRYRFTEDGPPAQNSSTLDLVKGALRVITGLIGQTNRGGYAVNTATATMGVRGTDHEPAYYPAGDPDLEGQEPGAFDKVNEGETFIRNLDGQEVVVGRGRIAFMGLKRGLRPRLLDDEPRMFRRHAEFDKRVAARREAMMKRIEERRRERQQLRMEMKDARQDAKAERNEKKAAIADKKALIEEKREARQERLQDKLEKRRAE
jgi:hypothetical protein